MWFTQDKEELATRHRGLLELEGQLGLLDQEVDSIPAEAKEIIAKCDRDLEARRAQLKAEGDDYYVEGDLFYYNRDRLTGELSYRRSELLVKKAELVGISRSEIMAGEAGDSIWKTVYGKDMVPLSVLTPEAETWVGREVTERLKSKRKQADELEKRIEEREKHWRERLTLVISIVTIILTLYNFFSIRLSVERRLKAIEDEIKVLKSKLISAPQPPAVSPSQVQGRNSVVPSQPKRQHHRKQTGP
jgi:hypothetical protein